MTHMKGLRWGAIALGLAALLMGVVWGRSQAAPYYDTLRIGGLWPLSGPAAARGKAFFKGARQAVDAVNEKGGLLHTPVELVAADTKGKTPYLLSRAVRLIDKENVVGLIGPGVISHARPLRLTADMHRVPLVLTEGYRPLLRSDREEPSWAFSVYPDVASCSRVLFRHLSRAGVKEIGLLLPAQPPFASSGLWVRAYAQEQLFKVAVQKYGVQDADVRYQLDEFKKLGCQVVVAVGPRGAGPMIVSSFKGYHMPLVVFTGMLSSGLLASAEMVGVRLISVLPPLMLGESISPTHPCAAQVMEFHRAMGSELGRMTLEERLAAGAAWDAAGLLLQAIRMAGSPDRSAVRNMLENMPQPYYGVMGIFRPDIRNHSRQLTRWLMVREWRGGKWVSMGRLRTSG